MSTITAILEPDADGTLHLPLPKGLWHGKIRVVATPLEENSIEASLTAEEQDALSRNLEEVRDRAGLKRRELPRAEEEARRDAALAALRQLREQGTFKEITDPVAWQREIREERPLRGRE